MGATEVYKEMPDAPWALISDHGNALTSRRLGSGRPGPWRKVGSVDSIGYPVVNFKETGPMRIHRLVALAFIGPPPFEGAVVRHLNDIKTDNRVENLAWGSHADNTADAVRNGGIASGPGSPAWKELCVRGHPMLGDNIYQPPNSHRMCRECRKIQSRERYHRLMAEGRHPRQLARLGGKDSDLYPTPWQVKVEIKSPPQNAD